MLQTVGRGETILIDRQKNKSIPLIISFLLQYGMGTRCVTSTRTIVFSLFFWVGDLTWHTNPSFAAVVGMWRYAKLECERACAMVPNQPRGTMMKKEETSLLREAIYNSST